MLKTRRCPLVCRVILFIAAIIPEAGQAESSDSEIEGRITEIQSAQNGSPNVKHTHGVQRGLSSVSPLSSESARQHENEALPAGRPQSSGSQKDKAINAPVPSVGNHAAVPQTNADAFPRPNFKTTNSEKGTLSGQISWLSGNFSNNRKESGNTVALHPLHTRVFIFNGKLKGLGENHYNKSPLEALQDPRLATVVTADREGKYETQLTPGTYTVLAEINGKLYKNSYDGSGYYSTVEVSAGKVSDEAISDNSAVSF